MRRLLPLVLLLTTPVWAITVDEVIQLAKAKVSDAVIIGKIRSDGSHFQLSVNDLLRLKQEGVSDAVMQAMVEASGPAEDHAPGPVVAPAAGGVGELSVTNADGERGYSLQVDARGWNLFVYYENMRDREVFKASQSRVLQAPSGTYRLRWVGEPQTYRVPIVPGKRTEVTLSGRQEAGGQVVSVDIAVDGQRVDGGPIKRITPAITPTKNPWGGFPSPEEEAQINRGMAPAPVVTAQTTYYYPQTWSYYRPTTVVEYRPVRYYYYVNDPGCCYYYGGGYGGYYSHSLIGPNTLFWTAAGGAIGAANHHVGAGLASGFLFGNLLDNAFAR